MFKVGILEKKGTGLQRTLKDPGLLKTQDPTGPRTLEGSGPLRTPGPQRTQDPREPRTLKDPGPQRTHDP